MIAFLSTSLGRKILIGLGAALIIGGLYWWGDKGWSKYHDLQDQADTVLLAVREASDNPDLEWKNAAGQVVALGESNSRLKGAIAEQNAAIDEMAREAVRLRARATELKRIADKAQAQRRSALQRLNDLSITPGTRTDCMTLLSEAEQALDIVRQASETGI